MNKFKKILIIVLGIIAILTIVIIFSKKEETIISNEEYQPEEEISISQERKTIVSLYFRNKISKEIEPEARLIDVKEIVENPYNTIMNLLLEGPKKDTLEKVIPEETKINNLIFENDTLIIDFSNEFIENHVDGEVVERQTIESIVKTFTELTEIDSIKILINGEENKEFKDGAVKFNQLFIREE